MSINSDKDLRSLHRIGLAVALAALVALAGLFASHDTAFAGFDPVASICLDNGATSPLPATPDCDGDSAIGASPDVSLQLTINKPDNNFAAIVNFMPPEWGVTPGDQIPIGALSAQVAAIATLGLIGGACDNINSVGFDMLNGTLDKSVQITFDDPDDVDIDDPPDRDDQFDIGADGLPLGVTRYPDYVDRIFPGLTPISRLYGQTVVGGIDVSLQFVTFAPGTTFSPLSTRLLEFTADPAMGYLSVVLLQAIGDPNIEPKPDSANSINDFCTPLLTFVTRFGVSRDNPDTAANEGGVVLLTNPSTAITNNFVNFFASQRDADGDGMQNSLDPCALIANPEWDPRVSDLDPAYSGDADKDRLPTACDPDDNTPSGLIGGVHDEDQDFYGNRADNCPRRPNGIDGAGNLIGPNNQKDTDNDGIGDACDPNPTDADAQGLSAKVCLVSGVDVGGGGAVTPQAPNVCGEEGDWNGNGVPDIGVGLDLNGDGLFDAPEATAAGGTGPADTGAGEAAATGAAPTGVTLTQALPATGTQLVVANAAAFSVGDFIQIDDEIMEITAIDGNTLTVKRCVRGTTCSAHESNAAILLLPDDTTATGDTTTTGVAGNGAAGGAATGVGSLAPVASSIPAWAAIASGLGGAGFLGALSAIASRIFGIRLPGRRGR